MEHSQKWIGWILIAGILIITIVSLGAYTLSGSASGNDSARSQSEEIIRGLFAQSGNLTLEPLESDGDFLYRVLFEGQPTGFAARQTVQGYAGPVEVITATGTDGVIQGIHVGGEGFRETEGLGARAKEPDFTGQFRAKKLPVMLERDIDAVAGATVTSQAVVDAVNLTLPRIQDLPEYMNEQMPLSTAETVSGRTANASAIGYGGPVLVRLTLDEAGAITALDIGGVRFAETEGLGSRVRDEAFIQQFIGLVPPLEQNRDIDAVSGATVSSQAVLDAVNEAAAFLRQENSSADTN